jgi:paraquat-inducible protein B
MSKKANPASIGLFIVVGAALGVAGLLLFSSSQLFTRSFQCVLYFQGSLNGLNQGAPVKYRGVTIGAVSKVMIHFNQRTNDYSMPVIIDIQENLLRERLEGAHLIESQGDLLTAVGRGLRGSLEAESLVTGVLYVSLDMLTNVPPPTLHQLKKFYVEIPTRPTDIQQLMQNLARVDLKGLEVRLSALITKLDSAIGNLNIVELSGRITNLLSSLDHIVTSPQITNTLGSIQKTMAEYQRLAETLNNRIDPLADSVTNTLAQANLTLGQLRGAVQDLGGMLTPDSPLRNDLSLALEQLAGAAQSISTLADFLERHPNSLITGRETPPKKP